uniref:Uncharacterized protein n=1 Tax=Rhizophora mucronata TaxID=61149 RepID=A0A2P2NEN9_RHIMU
MIITKMMKYQERVKLDLRIINQT